MDIANVLATAGVLFGCGLLRFSVPAVSRLDAAALRAGRRPASSRSFRELALPLRLPTMPFSFQLDQAAAGVQEAISSLKAGDFEESQALIRRVAAHLQTASGLVTATEGQRKAADRIRVSALNTLEPIPSSHGEDARGKERAVAR